MDYCITSHEFQSRHLYSRHPRRRRDTCESPSMEESKEDVALLSGSVVLRYYKNINNSNCEVATFPFKAGTSLEFLKTALIENSRSLILGFSNDKSFDQSRVKLVLPTDLSTPIDVRDVLHGRLKSVGILYGTDSTFNNLLTPPPIRKLPDNRIETGKDTTGKNQTRYIELMSLNKESQSGSTSGPQKITWDEVEEHCTAEDCWVVLHGQVYDISEYLDFHPGGSDILLDEAGKDVTQKFEQTHPWINAGVILKGNLKGTIECPKPSRNRRLGIPTQTGNLETIDSDEN